MSRISTTSHADWLRRVSDYHSGAVSEAERIAVEEHLATCADCQEALTMYRRFSTLLRSPLRLGAPGAAFDEAPTTVLRTQATTAPNPSTRLSQRPNQPPTRRRRALAGLAAAVAAALIVAGFLALLAPRLGLFTATGPKHQQTTTAAPNATGSAQATTTTPGVGAFICANPAGSTMDYAYVRADRNLYIVKGCNQPQKVASVPGSGSGYINEFPLAWSPSNRYLMFGGPNTNTNVGRVYAVDTQTGALLTTDYYDGYGTNLQTGDTAHIFIGWLDDTTFLGAHVSITQQSTGLQIGPMTLERVNAQTGQETAITKITWAANFAIRDNGQYLFYGGYQSTQEGGAWLHRITLA
ncbi:MAG: zf-HC2 domain-containing protein, partial [Ktedonobacterales bacterium]